METPSFRLKEVWTELLKPTHLVLKQAGPGPRGDLVWQVNESVHHLEATSWYVLPGAL